MSKLITALTDHFTEILIGIIEFCLKHMFQDVNNGMKLVIVLAGKGPGTLMPEAFEMIKSYLLFVSARHSSISVPTKAMLLSISIIYFSQEGTISFAV